MINMLLHTEFTGRRLVFAVANPGKGESFAEQAGDVLETIIHLAETNGVAIVGMSVFLADFGDRVEFRRMMADCFGAELPAVAFIPQRPCGGRRLAIELWGVKSGGKTFGIERIDDSTNILHCGDFRLVQLAGHFSAATGGTFKTAAMDAFRSIEERLARRGCRLEDVVRTWFYLGNINESENGEIRYKQLNSARDEVYRERRFVAERLPSGWNAPVFPASTGVGADGDGLSFSCLAVAGERPGLTVFPLENPQQTPAYEYDARFGDKSPKFARAMTLLDGGRALTFISGTASITTADSKHRDDIERQTRQTLDNIAALVSADNFSRHDFPDLGATLDDLLCARVYLKRAGDFERVSAICRERLGSLPVAYLICDICRPELLVEIEGIASIAGVTRH